MDAQQLAADHVRRFNACVAAGDFSPLVESIAEDATMAFTGTDFGPFAGRAAIAEAYRQSPPDDTIEVVDVRQTDPATALVAYTWRSDPAKATGQMRLAWGPDGRLRTWELSLP
ncbi:MAG: nuclear transport factor 2 family protein [Micromonosporaceae bacterium]|jgi:ketosteroid isomerase-like protein|nr:nuclear transport factor 2 family protein [Micromonosporaceae bacterium]